MKTLFEKLNYKGQRRIAVINTEKKYTPDYLEDLKDVQIDSEIDPRFPYDFMILIVKKESEVEKISPGAIHNLAVNGVLWYCFPKKTSGKYTTKLYRNHGWRSVNELGFYGTQMVSIDDDWSALRFRNKKDIKPESGKPIK